MTQTSSRILIIDDEPLNLKILESYLINHYVITTETSSTTAWQRLIEYPHKFDAILLDSMMPDISGIQLLNKIKQHNTLQYCPVIIQTVKNSSEDIAEAMNAGAYYYLTKPFDKKVLFSIIKTAIHDYENFKAIQASLDETQCTIGLLYSATFQFKSIKEARSIATLISKTTLKAESIALGLTELLINAVEHGNLGISYDEKSILNEQDTWTEEINRRAQLPENINKIVSISFERHSHFIEIIIIDQGDGFKWKKYMDFDPNRAMHNHGRGIAMANKLSFSSIEYKGSGNEVWAIILFD